jgi:3-oxoacyl-[acyl-carrier protein] reductase
MTTRKSLDGRVALVTGASRGIGAAIAVALAEAGAAVAVNYRERASEAEAVVAKITGAGGRAMAIAADVSQSGAVATMADHVSTTLGQSIFSSTTQAWPSCAALTI